MYTSWNRPTGDTTLKKTQHAFYLLGAVERNAVFSMFTAKNFNVISRTLQTDRARGIKQVFNLYLKVNIIETSSFTRGKGLYKK